MFARAATIIETPVPLLFLLLYKRFKLFKDKYFWYAVIVAVLIFLPNLISIYAIHGGNPVSQFFGLGTGRFKEAAASGAPHFDIALYWLFALPASMGWPLYIPLIFGLYIFFEMFLGLDLIIRKKEEAKKLFSHLFLLIWLIIPFSYHTIYAGSAIDERYFFYIYPPLFMLSAHGFMLMFRWFNKALEKVANYKLIKYIPIIFVVILLSFGGYLQIKQGDQLIKIKQGSYYPVKLAGLWIKENSEPTDIVISGSRYQNIYYSERNTYNYALERFVSREYVLEQSKKQNISRETHGYLTEEAFDEQIKKLKPRYMAVSIFESHPPWSYTYADRHSNVRPVQAYFLDQEQKQLGLIIYEFTGYEPAKAPTQ